MDTIKAFINQSVKDNRKVVLVLATIISIISAGTTSLLNQQGFWYLGLIISTALTVYYFSKINDLTETISNGNDMSFKMLLEKASFKSRHLVGFALYVGVALVTFLLINLLASVPFGGIIIVIMILFAVAVMTGIISLYIEGDEPLQKSLKQGFKTVITTREILVQYIIYILKTVITGAIITLAINVFVFGPSIQKTLQIENVANEEIIAYFVNPVANFIQVAGAQTIVLYILFIGCASYKILGRQLEFRSKKKKRRVK